jgi:hypothetical protein
MIVAFLQKVNKKDNFEALLKVYEDYLDQSDLDFCQKVETSVKKVVQLKELYLTLHLKEQAEKLQIIVNNF